MMDIPARIIHVRTLTSFLYVQHLVPISSLGKSNGKNDVYLNR
jgi:hypothetical protein